MTRRTPIAAASPIDRRWSRAIALGLAAAIVLSAFSQVPRAQASAPPVLPQAEWGGLLGSLNAPALAPGGSGSVSGVVSNPLETAMTGVQLSLGYYEFNAFPGNATGPIPTGAGASLVGPNSTGVSVTFALGPLAAGTSEPFQVTTVVGAGAPDGTYAIRIALTFLATGSSYLLESRGYFSAAAWASATTGPNNTTVLNASRLGVSGVVPETAVVVRSPAYSWVLYGFLSFGLVLAGLGAYVAWRRGPGSRSGPAGPARPQSAPNAFGKSRRSDGD